MTALQALGAAITMVGVAAIAAQGDPARLARLAFNHGDVMMLAAVVLYAGYTIGLRDRPRVSGLSLLAGMAVAAFVTSVPLMIWEIVSGGFIWPTAADSRRSPMWRLGLRSPRSCSTCEVSN